jgi:hypothetical protein
LTQGRKKKGRDERKATIWMNEKRYERELKEGSEADGEEERRRWGKRRRVNREKLLSTRRLRGTRGLLTRLWFTAREGRKEEKSSTSHREKRSRVSPLPSTINTTLDNNNNTTRTPD